MKSTQYSLFKRMTFFAVILTAFAMISSCGNKGNNEVVDDGPNIGGPGSPPISGTPPIVNGVDTSAIWEQQKSGNPCRAQYGNRLGDRHFNVAASGYYVQGTMMDGHAGGSVQAVFMGINPTTKDLLRVIQVSDGSGTRYNITTSFCGWNAFIRDDVPMSQFQIYQGVVSNSFNCPVGIINRAIVVFNSGNYGNIQTVFQPISNQCL